jgi:hypothetical protein
MSDLSCVCCCCTPETFTLTVDFSTGSCSGVTTFTVSVTYDPAIGGGFTCWQGEKTVQCGVGSVGACNFELRIVFTVCCTGALGSLGCQSFQLSTDIYVNGVFDHTVTALVNSCSCDPFTLTWTNWPFPCVPLSTITATV